MEIDSSGMARLGCGEPLGLVQWASMLCCAIGLGLALFQPASSTAR